MKPENKEDDDVAMSFAEKGLQRSLESLLYNLSQPTVLAIVVVVPVAVVIAIVNLIARISL